MMCLWSGGEEEEEEESRAHGEGEIIWRITHLQTLLCATTRCTSSGHGRLYLEGFLHNYIVSPVPESISVTCQRQLRSLNMLPDYQLSASDRGRGEHLFSRNLPESHISSGWCVINADLISEIQQNRGDLLGYVINMKDISGEVINTLSTL